jgi:LysR family glycine cleavage system transcriptional activator
MKRQLPPLNGLRIFEEVARHESFTSAAETLKVTSGAVSKQVRLLESYLEVRLFERNGYKIELTDAGKMYYRQLFEAFNQIETSTTSVKGKQVIEDVTLGILPSMGVLCLSQSMNVLQQCYSKGQRLNVVSSDSKIDLANLQIDVAIRCNPSNKSNRRNSLFDERLLLIMPTDNPVVSENFTSCSCKLSAYLKNQTLISMRDRNDAWPLFFQKYKLKSIPSNKNIVLEYFHMVIDAVLNGHGIGLVPDFYCQKYLKQGRLINPMGAYLSTDYTYSLLIPDHKKDCRVIINIEHVIRSRVSDIKRLF